MPKKIINILISVLIIVFSFFYTNEIIKISRNNDPIMIEIKKINDSLTEMKEEPVILENDIIPGMKNKAIDIDKSYQVMKKAGKFDRNLLVFQENTSKESIKNQYKKYIVSLNKSQNNISLAFALNNSDNLLRILSILKNKNINATFFLTKELFANLNLIKKVIDDGNQVELLSNTYTIYEVNKYNSHLKFISKEKLNYCLNINKDDELLKTCNSSKLYTVTTNKIIDNNLYHYIKNNLSNGLIMVLDNSNDVVRELSSTINYINQKGKKFVLLKSIIE